MTASVALGGGYLGYVDRTLWEPARYRHATAEAKSRIDGEPVNITGVLRRKFGFDRIGPPDNQEYVEYTLFELTFIPPGTSPTPIKAKYGKFLKSDAPFADLKWSGDEAQTLVRYAKSNPKEFYLPGQDPGDLEEVAVPLLAGFFALLYRAVPLGIVIWLIFVTLFGLLKPRI